MSSDAQTGVKGEVFGGPDTRARLLAALRAEILGPGLPDEVLQQSPATRYLVGMLAPHGTKADPSEDENLETEENDDGTQEDGTRISASLDPSSIGISCAIAEEIPQIDLVASWGEYGKEESPDDVTVPEESGSIDRDEDPDTPTKKRKSYVWKRVPEEVVLTISTEPTASPQSEEIGQGVALEWTIRKLGESRVISAFLANQRDAPEGKRPPDELWLYQPKLELKGDQLPFVPRPTLREHADPDPDVASADLIYRHRREFATGHGSGADWKASIDGARAEAVWTETIPATPVPIVEPRQGEDLPSLDMDYLATCDEQQLRSAIDPLLDSYEHWIAAREEELPRVPQLELPVAEDHIKLARKALERMRAGVDTLVDQEDALSAFQFANAAMAAQIKKSTAVRHHRQGLPNPPNQSATWRPFQLGFFLLCVPGLVDPTEDDRDIADLLWFPTGGGKTEAYLGLTAFTFALRRLKADDAFDYSCGTTVIMRYTLRLLTVQQFSRALTLLCACEHLREADEETWGPERFTVGLWVGAKTTPNSYVDSKNALEDLMNDKAVYEGSPYQVLYCPWCGYDLSPHNYKCDDDLERTLIKCSNGDCDFSPSRCEYGLPVLLVDQEIYRHPPSLLLATVDKFAQMAWNGRIQALYGRVSRRCPRHGFLSTGEQHPKKHNETKGFPSVSTTAVDTPLGPPELIIQDELHLISGPLGTLVGIYESAVEGLCRREDGKASVRPKVIASTATIRRADRQIESLFSRDAAIFPPLGLSADDSFFAKEAPLDERPGRLYVGVYAPGKSIKTAVVRVYAALLSRAQYEYENTPDLESDSYMTLVGYFNSLRELGGAVRLVEDDVPARLRVLDRRGFGPRRPIYEPHELTSRKRGSEIPAVLKRLELTFAEKEAGSYPVDVLLASNMISVGVDIGRLGLMVVSGQPKTSAEYIQATSRVGRVHPGLVIDVFNWSRPRDTSHYERFRNFHETFYRHVEATSVTPFSARARDRALAGVLSSYVRLDDPNMSAETSADHFDPQSSSVSRILEQIVDRARLVTRRDDVGEETRQQLLNLIAEWDHWAGDEPPLVYTGRGLKQTDIKPILLRDMERRGARGIWPVANSLREVEGEVDVVLREAQS